MKQTVPESIRRLLALLLCAVMLLPNFTVLARAEEPVDENESTANVDVLNDEQPLAVVYAASDFQAENSNKTEDSVSAGMTTMQNIIDKTGYTKVDGAFFCGDYSANFDTWTKGKEEAALEAVNAGANAVKAVLFEKWGLTDEEVIYVQGNHDPAGFDNKDAGGENDTEHYGVYVLHEDDFPWKQGGTSTASGNAGNPAAVVKATAEALEVYLKNKADLKYGKPIFICAHVPLHYGWRTEEKDGDNIYAKDIFDVLNKYGEKLNIIYLFGHNHSSTYDDYLGGAAVYLAKGDTIRVPNLGSSSGSAEYALNFTYMNAGYVGYFGGKTTTGLSSTIFEIYGDRVVVARYDVNGVANLKDVGVLDTSNNRDNWTGAQANTTTYPSSQVISLSAFEPGWEDEQTSGVLLVGSSKTLSVSGVYGNTYNVAWSSSDSEVASVAANGMSASVTAGKIGEATITALVTKTTTRQVMQLTYDVEVLGDETVVLAEAGKQTFFILDDNQDRNTWAADTSKRYVIVSQDKGNVTAGEFMAMYYNGQLDAAEGDAATDGAWRELNAEPITVMQLPVNGQSLYAVSTSDTSYMWVFQSVDKNDEYNWYYVEPEINHNYAWMLSKGHTESDLKLYDTDNDGIRLRGVSDAGTTDGSIWRMSDRGAGLTAKRNTGSGYYFAPYYDSIQGDISVYYTQNGDENMGYRVYMYEETNVTLENPIIAYMADKTGSVSKGVGADAGTGDVIYIQNGEQVVTVPVTVGMLSGGFNTDTAGSYSNLTITYAGKVIADDYTLEVTEATTLLKNEGGKFRSTIYRLVEEMIGGRHYLIVDNNQAGEAHAMGAANRSDSSERAGVTAHNVLIQPFTVGGEDGLYIDSTRYSADPDTPLTSIVEDQGNVNANIFTNDHKAAIRLVWTPSVIQANPNASNNKFDNVYTADLTRRLMISEYEDGRLWLDDKKDKLVVFWGGSTSNEEEWSYVPTGTGSSHIYEGLVLTYKVTNFRLCYSYENFNSSSWMNKNFVAVGKNSDANRNPIGRRTWLYEQVDDIDTITARINDLSATVTKGCNAATTTGDYILVETYLTDGTVELVKVPVRVSMLSGDLNTAASGTYSGLTVTYEGKVITNNYTLTVKDPSFNDYPEFPDEGAVRINKKADTTTYNYLETGVATIDLSVTGIPSQSGVDIIFILDTSSSMERCIHHKEQRENCSTCDTVTEDESRLYLLKETLVQTLKDLQAPINGYTPDIDVAVACFNGYTPIDTDYLVHSRGDTFTTPQHQHVRVDSSVVTLDFTDVSKLSQADMETAAEDLYKNAGTNYDRGIELAYNMLKAKQEESASNGETRQQILVFMSDGAPFQFNYIHGDSDEPNWSPYLMGELSENESLYVKNNALFREYYNTEGRHWLTEAIKGSPDQKYKIIDPDMQDSETKINYVNGLGATVYTVGMGITSDLDTTAESCNHVLSVMASPTVAATDTTPEKKYFYSCTEPEHFRNAFSEIADTVRNAGNAVFTDQLGSCFDLVTAANGTYIKDGVMVEAAYDPAPFIEVKDYELYKRSEIGETLTFTNENGTTTTVNVTEEIVGTRKPVEPTIVERITFNANGTEITSTKKSGNILNGYIIEADTFFYNTDKVNSHDISVGGKTVSLEPETFYWMIGDVPQNERVLTYCVYLQDSMQGDQVEGTYDTNAHAELNYINYLGNACELKVPSPKLPWNQGTVGYAFYLVDGNGKPIINQTTGETGSFVQAVRITQPVYEDFMLNNAEDGHVNANIVAKKVLPDGYTLYDDKAEYNVALLSNGEGSYQVTIGKQTATTYVEGVEAEAVLPNNEVVNTESYKTANTIVWFAVTATVQCVPDTVVIDYGLPVDISVLANDTMMGNDGKLAYIGSTDQFTGYTGKLWEYLQGVGVVTEPKFTSETVDGENGVITVQKDAAGKATGKVRYTLNKSNGMQMKDEETFVYAVDYTGRIGTQGYYYSTVTIIPATTIYYEDNFVTYLVKNYDTAEVITDSKVQWTQEGTYNDVTQAEDRPGEFSLDEIDANNIYGFDGAYTNMTTYSMNNWHKVTVGKQTLSDNSEVITYANANFTFNGTGFDIVSVTSDQTGTIVVKVKGTAANGTAVSKNFMVDTYYGYYYDEETEQWIVDTDATYEGKNALYQIPVMKVSDLPYGKYDVTISVSHKELYDHGQYDGTKYDFYLDAIRIYDPANDGAGNQVIEDAYKADGEGWPSYQELRNMVISAKDFNALEDDTQTSSAIFIDNTAAQGGKEYTIADYKSYGPNNELYLAPGQAVSFVLEAGKYTETVDGKEVTKYGQNIAGIHLAMKSVNGETIAKIYDGEKFKADEVTGKDVNTATDLYYDVTDLNGKVVVIYNAGNAGNSILSITNIKTTHLADSAGQTATTLMMSRGAASVALMSLRSEVSEPVEPEVPETTVPETTEPEVPETTVPETTEPEVPETTVPETTEPEVPDTTVPETTEPEEEPEEFKPRKFKVSVDQKKIKVGATVVVTVTTSSDVDYITVNGEEITKFTTNHKKTERTWRIRVKAEEAGKLEISVVCYDDDDNASDPKTKTIEVTKKKNDKGNGSSLLGLQGLLDLLDMILGYYG